MAPTVRPTVHPTMHPTTVFDDYYSSVPTHAPTPAYAVSTANNPTTNLVVSIMWITILVVVFGSFQLLFKFVIRPLVKSRAQSTQTFVAPVSISETGGGVEMNSTANKMHVIHFTEGGNESAHSTNTDRDNATYEVPASTNPAAAHTYVRGPFPPAAGPSSSSDASMPSIQRDEGSIAVQETRFHLEGWTQFGYNNVVGGSLHVISVNDDMIRAADIWSSTFQAELLAQKSGEIESILAPSDCMANTCLVPIEMFTHMDARAAGWQRSTVAYYVPSFHQALVRMTTTSMETSWRYWSAVGMGCTGSHSILNQLSPRIAFYSFLLAIIISFYIPTSMNTGTNLEGKRRTAAVFFLVLVASLFQLVFFRAVWTAKSVNFVWKAYAASLWISMIPALGLVAALFSITLGALGSQSGGGNNSSSSGGDSSSDAIKNAFAAFTCGCPTVQDNSTGTGFEMNSSYPTLFPTSYPTALPTANMTSVAVTQHNSTPHYSFECDAAQLVDGHFQTCNVNCGTCGSMYYDIFVAFAAMAAVYLLMMLVLLHVHTDCCPVIDVQIVDTSLKSIVVKETIVVPAHTHMVVTLHGSKAFGFPITTRLTVRDTLRLEKHLAEMVVRNREKGKRDPKYLPHLVSTHR
jgi:uncharacterized membrane protein